MSSMSCCSERSERNIWIAKELGLPRRSTLSYHQSFRQKRFDADDLIFVHKRVKIYTHTASLNEASACSRITNVVQVMQISATRLSKTKRDPDR